MKKTYNSIYNIGEKLELETLKKSGKMIISCSGNYQDFKHIVLLDLKDIKDLKKQINKFIKKMEEK